MIDEKKNIYQRRVFFPERENNVQITKPDAGIVFVLAHNSMGTGFP